MTDQRKSPGGPDESQPEAPRAPQGTPFQPPTAADEKTPIDLFKEKVLEEYDRMGLDDGFTFGCHPGVPCFNECCSDVNIFLTPYDVLRMKNRLGMDSAEFLEQYTQIPVQKAQKFPVVMFKLGDDEKKTCQLVGEQGCTIYEDRPWPCRMYPLGMASPKEGAEDEEFYFLMKEDECEGFSETNKWTVREWLDDQGMASYDEFGRLYKEITLHDYFAEGKTLGPEKIEMFYMACYDLDSFRRFVFESTFLKRFDVQQETLDKIREDDEELLRFAFRWVKFAMYGEKTIAIKPDALGPSGR